MLTNLMKRYPLSLLVTVIIVVLSLAPIGRVEFAEDVPLADKWTHMVMYGFLALVVWWETVRRGPCPSWSYLLVVGLLLPIALGGLLEILQSTLTTYRSGEWLDFVADALGALVGSGLGLLFLFFTR